MKYVVAILKYLAVFFVGYVVSFLVVLLWIAGAFTPRFKPAALFEGILFVLIMATIPITVSVVSVSIVAMAMRRRPLWLHLCASTAMSLMVPGILACVLTMPPQGRPDQFAPALFGFNLGTLQAIATNGDGSIVGPAGAIPGITSHPAAAGDTITLFATGLGPVDPPMADGVTPNDASRQTANPVTVLIGTVPGTVGFAGLSPQFLGVYQLNVVVPGGVSAGGAIAVQAQVGGITSPDPVTIALQ